MVLEKMEKGVNSDEAEFIFKNTYTDDKKVRLKVNDDRAPNQLYFVHIEVSSLFWSITCAKNCSAMLLISCFSLIRRLYENDCITEEKMNACLAFIKSENVNAELRAVIDKTVKKLHVSGDQHATLVRFVSWVSTCVTC